MTNTIYKIEMHELKKETTDLICEMYGVSPKALLTAIKKEKFSFSEYREHFIKAVEKNSMRTEFTDGNRKFIIRVHACPLNLEG